MTEEIDGLALLVNELDDPFLTFTRSLETYKEVKINCIDNLTSNSCNGRRI